MNRPATIPLADDDRHAHQQPIAEPAPAGDRSDEEVLEVSLGLPRLARQVIWPIATKATSTATIRKDKPR